MPRREVPNEWSHHAADFVNRLILRKFQNRLGSKGIEEVKSHPWLEDVNWQAIINKTAPPPFIPIKEENFASKQVLQNDPWLVVNAEQVN